MKDSTNLSFFIKVLALVILLIVGYSKEDLFSSSEADKDKFNPLNSDTEASVHFSPLVSNEESSKLASLTSKK